MDEREMWEWWERLEPSEQTGFAELEPKDPIPGTLLPLVPRDWFVTSGAVESVSPSVTIQTLAPKIQRFLAQKRAERT